MATEITIYENQRRLALMTAPAILIRGGLAAIYAGHGVFHSYGLSPGDGGMLNPLQERAAFAATLAFLGLVCLIGGLIYMYRYVTRIRQLNRAELAISTLKR